MLSPALLGYHLLQCASGNESIGDFDEWFADASWNIHEQREEVLEQAVFRVEMLLTSYNDGTMSKAQLSARFRELRDELVRPFARLTGLAVTDIPRIPPGCQVPTAFVTIPIQRQVAGLV